MARAKKFDRTSLPTATAQPTGDRHRRADSIGAGDGSGIGIRELVTRCGNGEPGSLFERRPW